MKQLSLLSLFVISMLVIPNMGNAQTISNFFEKRTNYSAVRMKIPLVREKGGADFSLGVWKYYNIKYHINTDPFFSIVPIDKIINSIGIEFSMSHENLGLVRVRAAEIHLKSPVGLSELGVEFASSNLDPVSQYFIIAYLVDERSNSLNKALWRMVLYLNDTLDVVGEIVGREEIYFVKSHYSYLPENSATLVDSRLPSLFFVEKSDQYLIGAFNNLSLKVLWQSDDLSFSDQTALGICTGILHTMKFTIGNSGTMLSQKKRAIRRQEQEAQDSFLIDKNIIYTPDRLEDDTVLIEDATENEKSTP